MSRVQRFNFSTYHAEVYENPAGRYVAHSDYEKLEKEAAELRKALQTIAFELKDDEIFRAVTISLNALYDKSAASFKESR